MQHGLVAFTMCSALELQVHQEYTSQLHHQEEEARSASSPTPYLGPALCAYFLAKALGAEEVIV